MNGHKHFTDMHDRTQTDPLHPRHSEGTREGNIVAALILLGGFVLVMSLSLPSWLSWLILFVVLMAAAVAWWTIHRHFSRKAEQQRRLSGANKI